MTAPIDDVSSLPGKKVTDQEETQIGEIKDIYAIDGDGEPMWVSVEASFGLGEKRIVLIPLARLKDEDGELRVPYSKNHISQTPEVDDSEGITPESDRKLRDHFGIDRADQELRSDNDSYATLVPENEGTAQRVDDPEQLETPNADKIDDETKARLEDVGSAETRSVTADDVTKEAGATGEESTDDENSKKDDPQARSGEDDEQKG